MDRKEYLYYCTHKLEAPKGLWYYRNEAVKFFNLKKGEVIHHLIDTPEQKKFNNEHYERWGFDLNGEMKYAIKMTTKEHDGYHASLRKGKKNTDEHKRKCSEASKKLWEDSDFRNRVLTHRADYWKDENAHKRQSEAIKRYFANEDNRKKLSDTMKDFSFWTDGEHTVYQRDCPDGWYRGYGTLKVNGEKREEHHPQFIKRRKHNNELLKCIETGELFDIYEVSFRKSRVPSHAVDVADGKRNIAGGYHWCWVNKEVQNES